MQLKRGGAQRGLTMIEVLVTLFVLSTGMLGVAGLQSVGILAGHASTKRSLAVIHSADIADRMRANRSAIGTYDSAVTSAGVNNNCTDTSTSSADVCTSVELAEDDIFHWKKSLQVAYVSMSPSATISVDTTLVPSMVTIDLNWTEHGEVMSYVTSLRI